MPIPRDTQTTAIFGTAIFGLTVFGAVLGVTGGLPSVDLPSGVRVSPWRRLPVATTTWTPV